MRITLEYDTTTGQLTDKAGAMVGSWVGAQGFDDKGSGFDVGELIQLKASGFTADEIVSLKGVGLLDK